MSTLPPDVPGESWIMKPRKRKYAPVLEITSGWPPAESRTGVSPGKASTVIGAAAVPARSMSRSSVYVPARTSARWPAVSVLSAFWIVRHGCAWVPGLRVGAGRRDVERRPRRGRQRRRAARCRGRPAVVEAVAAVAAVAVAAAVAEAVAVAAEPDWMRKTLPCPIESQ